MSKSAGADKGRQAKRRVAIYARVSTKDKQDVDNQLIPLREAAAAIPGATLAEEYVEHESAAGRIKRKVWERMMQDGCREGKYDLLLFWSLDRFSREGPGPTLLALQRLSDASVGWRSLQEPLLDTTSLGPFRDVLIALLAAVAQLETQRRSERAKAAIQRRIKQGKRIGKPRKHIPLDRLKEMKAKGFSNVALSRYFQVSRTTIIDRLKELDRIERDLHAGNSSTNDQGQEETENNAPNPTE